jgi:hypothetical protein
MEALMLVNNIVFLIFLAQNIAVVILILTQLEREHSFLQKPRNQDAKAIG